MVWTIEVTQYARFHIDHPCPICPRPALYADLDCTNYQGPCNNDCYVAYVANKPLVWRNCLPQEEIWALTSVLRPLTTMDLTASPAHTRGQLVVSPLPHVAMAKWQLRILMRIPAMNILMHPLSKVVAEQFFSALTWMRTRERVGT